MGVGIPPYVEDDFGDGGGIRGMDFGIVWPSVPRGVEGFRAENVNIDEVGEVFGGGQDLKD